MTEQDEPTNSHCATIRRATLTSPYMLSAGVGVMFDIGFIGADCFAAITSAGHRDCCNGNTATQCQWQRPTINDFVLWRILHSVTFFSPSYTTIIALISNAITVTGSSNLSSFLSRSYSTFGIKIYMQMAQD